MFQSVQLLFGKFFNVYILKSNLRVNNNQSEFKYVFRFFFITFHCMSASFKGTMEKYNIRFSSKNLNP